MPDRAGYVYIYGGEGVYKIGRAKDPAKRVNSLTKPPFKAQLVHAIESDDAVLLEAHLHERFRPCRANGEWFNLSDADLSALKQQPRMLTQEIMAARAEQRRLIEAEKQRAANAARAEQRRATEARMAQQAAARVARQAEGVPDARMYSRLGVYLRTLKTAENLKPAPQRRAVPTVVELAGAVGVHPNTMNDYANGHVIRFDLHLGNRLLHEFWRRGFKTRVDDLIGYIDGDDSPDESRVA